MLTRCPACQTVFRLRPEQLRARHGEVRCGHCFNPFNALEHLIQEAAPEPAPQPAPAASQLPPAAPPTPLPDAAAHAQDAALFTAPAAAPDTPPAAIELDFTLPDNLLGTAPAAAIVPPPAFLVDAAPDGGAWPDPEPTTARVSFDALMKREAPPPSLPGDEAGAPALAAAPTEPAIAPPPPVPEVFRAERRPGATRREEPTVEAAPDDHPAFSSAINAPSAVDLDTAAAAPAVEPYAAVPPANAAPATREARQARIEPGTAAVDTERLDATYGRPPPPASPLARTAWGLAVTVLASALAVQGAYLFRAELSRELPGLRPLYVAACAQLGCDMPLPRDAALFDIENSDLQSEPGRPGRHMLYATVKNRAPYPQAWPHLELTLTDAQDGPLARRVFAPEEWVGAAPLDNGFRARSDTVIRLAFDTPGVQATGYRVYVFYP